MVPCFALDKGQSKIIEKLWSPKGAIEVQAVFAALNNEFGKIQRREDIFLILLVSSFYPMEK